MISLSGFVSSGSKQVRLVFKPSHPAWEWGVEQYLAQDCGGLGGYQQPQPYSRTSNRWHQSHHTTAEQATTQAWVIVLGLLLRAQYPNPLWGEKPTDKQSCSGSTSWLPLRPLLRCRLWLCALWQHHKSPWHDLHLSCLVYTPVFWALHSLLLCLLTQDQGQGIPLPEMAP